jgi:hypothetical protein
MKNQVWEIMKRSVWANLAFFLLALLVGYGVMKIARDALVARDEVMGIDRRVEELTRQKADLEEYLRELQTPGGIEREAKERLNLKKTGEEVVVVMPREELSQGTAEKQKRSLWDFVREFFGLTD